MDQLPEGPRGIPWVTAQKHQGQPRNTTVALGMQRGCSGTPGRERAHQTLPLTLEESFLAPRRAKSNTDQCPGGCYKRIPSAWGRAAGQNGAPVHWLLAADGQGWVTYKAGQAPCAFPLLGPTTPSRPVLSQLAKSHQAEETLWRWNSCSGEEQLPFGRGAEEEKGTLINSVWKQEMREKIGITPRQNDPLHSYSPSDNRALKCS